MKKAFVLLSGGLDSTTCLYQAIYDYGAPDTPNDIKHRIRSNQGSPRFDPIPWVEAVSISYGQRHAKEMDYAAATCNALGITHTILDIGNLLRGSDVMLSSDSVGKVNVPDIDYTNIKGVSPTYVPYRNGLMLSALTAHAQKWVNKENSKRSELVEYDLLTGTGADVGPKAMAGIYFGAHSEDAHAWAYPDCTPEFIGSMANAIYIGSYMQIRLHTPLQWLNKEGVVKLGHSLDVPFKNTWSCYKGEELHCGTCPTCRSRRQAFEAAKVSDPTVYAS